VFVSESYRIGEISPDPGGLPARFVLKTAIPVGFLLLMLQGLSLALQSLLKILNRDNEREEMEV